MRVRYSFSSRHVRNLDNTNVHKQGFPKIVRELIDKCEIILEILDARFIEETRNKEIESLIKQKNKQIVYVINKSDLANPEETKKALESNDLFPHVLISAKDRKGIGILRERIKMEATKIRDKFSKTNIGVIGYPNTGKSSIINMIIGRSVARTAPEAGFTKGIQKLKLSENVYILDTPGVIPEARYSMEDSKKMAEHVRLGARNYDRIDEPEFAVHRLMQQYPRAIEKHYDINANGDSELLIEELGKRKKFLLPRNRVDSDRTARVVLKEWQEGKIKSE